MRFLIVGPNTLPGGAGVKLRVVQNWFEELREQVPWVVP